MPTLYVVATPIGNLEDITLRALRILKEVSVIAAEDTRKTKRLLTHYDIRTPMTSYYEHNKLTKLDHILGYLESGDVALVSEAGTPGISDPGYELVVAAGERKIPVIAVPGASSVVSALSVSGLATDRFTFLGFLPRKAGARRKVLTAAGRNEGTLIVLESPRRLIETLTELGEILGDRRIAVCRELTKIHEETYRGTIRTAIEYFQEPRGEFTLVVEGFRETAEPDTAVNAEAMLAELKRAGLTAKDAIAQTADETGLTRKALYKAWLKQG